MVCVLRRLQRRNTHTMPFLENRSSREQKEHYVWRHNQPNRALLLSLSSQQRNVDGRGTTRSVHHTLADSVKRHSPRISFSCPIFLCCLCFSPWSRSTGLA